MKVRQTATIGILVVGMGLFGVESANAKNPLTEAPAIRLKPLQRIAPSTHVAQSSSYTIAQVTDANNPLYGSWKLTYSVDGIVYQSVLVMNGYSGAMRTRYFDPNFKKPQVVDQTIRLKSSSKGLVLLGYNPVYAGTSRKHPTYSADNFRFSLQPDGSVVIVNCDDAQQCSAVDVETIK